MEDWNNNNPKRAEEPCNDRIHPVNTSQGLTSQDLVPRDLAHCFQRLANLDNGVFERLGRYEAAIARQVLKTLYLLRSIRAR
jgi:hypothetical protein